jgi:hypothetical protein
LLIILEPAATTEKAIAVIVIALTTFSTEYAFFS